MSPARRVMEIVSRPQPRQPATGGPVAVIMLAAGQSRRMGRQNKLLAEFDGEPLVRRSAKAALASKAAPVIVVTHKCARSQIDEALEQLSSSPVVAAPPPRSPPPPPPPPPVTLPHPTRRSRAAARRHHPDLGGDLATMIEVNAAWAELRRRFEPKAHKASQC